jgi:hypothetical protein
MSLQLNELTIAIGEVICKNRGMKFHIGEVILKFRKEKQKLDSEVNQTAWSKMAAGGVT